MPLSPEDKARLNAKLKALLAEPTTQANDTKTTRERKQEFEKRFGYSTPTADLVARIEAAERVVWVPHSYVFFVRQATCRNCRTTVRCLDDARLFLQKRKERRDDSNPYLYEPVKEIEFVKLPRQKVLRVMTTPVCESCFEGASCQTTSSSSLNPEDTASQQDATASSPSRLDTNLSEHTQLLAVEPSPSSFPSSSLSSTSGEESSGLPSETDFGSACGEREFGPNADVKD